MGVDGYIGVLRFMFMLNNVLIVCLVNVIIWVLNLGVDKLFCCNVLVLISVMVRFVDWRSLVVSV